MEYYVKTGIDNMQFDAVKNLLQQSYWANTRTEDTIRTSMVNSICYGVFMSKNDKQVGFARVITDYSTTYYICDVIVDAEYRGRGIGTMLMDTIENTEAIANLRGLLVTRDAHGLYRKYGFGTSDQRFMGKNWVICK